MAALGYEYVSNLSSILSEGMLTKPRNIEVKEKIGVVLKGGAADPQSIAFSNLRDVTDANTNEGKYLRSELFWYLSGSNTTEFIGLIGNIWNKIKNTDGTINSNYGRTVFYEDANGNAFGDKARIDWVVNQLYKDKDTRQAIIQYANPRVFDYNYGNDFTCTQLQHFFIRNNKLHSIVYIRSSDAVFGLNFDIPFWSIAYQYIKYALAAKYPYLKLKDGDFTIFIGSSHIYSPHYKLCENIVKNIDKADTSFKYLSLKKSAVEAYQSDGFISNTISSLSRYFDAENIKFEADLIRSNNSFKVDVAPKNIRVLYVAKYLMGVFKYCHMLLSEKYKDEKVFKEKTLSLWEPIINNWFDMFFEFKEV